MIVNKKQQVLFLDIETTPEYPTFNDLPELLQELWEKKSEQMYAKGELKHLMEQHHFAPAFNAQKLSEIYNDKAALFPEWCKVVCASFGIYDDKDNWMIKSFSGSDEQSILMETARVIKNHMTKNGSKLCAFNGKGFDFPVLTKRMFIKKIDLPLCFITHNKKPWELIDFIDPCELWKFGSQGTATLRLLAFLLLGVDAKELMSGGEVRIYASEEKFADIEKYCESDVSILKDIFMIMNERI